MLRDDKVNVKDKGNVKQFCFDKMTRLVIMIIMMIIITIIRISTTRPLTTALPYLHMYACTYPINKLNFYEYKEYIYFL